MKTSEIREEARASCQYPYVKPEIVDQMIDHADYWRVPETGTMVCAIILKNGFTVIDHAACVDVRNFNEKIAKKLSYSKARDKVFHYLAFAYLDEKYEQQ